VETMPVLMKKNQGPSIFSIIEHRYIAKEKWKDKDFLELLREKTGQKGSPPRGDQFFLYGSVLTGVNRVKRNRGGVCGSLAWHAGIYFQSRPVYPIKRNVINLGKTCLMKTCRRQSLNEPCCHFDHREKSSRVPEISAPAKIPRFARNDTSFSIVLRRSQALH